MDPITLTGLAAFFIVGSLVGLRLAGLWLRTRRLPELLIAIGILGMGPCGFALGTAAALCADSSPELARRLWTVALLSMNLGGGAMAFFNWIAFRRASNSARVFAHLMVMGFIGVFAVDVGQVPFFESGVRSASLQLGSWMLIACFLWGAAESMHFSAILRRRQELGLADAVLTNRFRLWGVGIGAAGIGTAIGMIGTTIAAPEPAPMWVFRSGSAHGILSAVTLWLAFLPPGAYCRAITARAARLQSPS